LRTILFSGLAVIAASALAPASAGPMPLNPAFSADDGALTLVRDGCGRGFRFSNYRQACVPIEGSGGGGYGAYGGGGYVDPGAAAAAAVAAGVAGAIIGGSGGRGGGYRGGGGGGQRMGGGGGGPRVGAGGGGNRSQGFAGPPQNWKKPGTGIR